MRQGLPYCPSVLAVCAHPDDESFGLGAVLSTMADAGSRLGVLCFTHGEASTLHGLDVELGAIRAVELEQAGHILGVGDLELLGYPDAGLGSAPPDDLAGHVTRLARTLDASLLLVFDDGGITGHPDHQHATGAALAGAATLDVPVLGWALPQNVAHTLNQEFSTVFVGRRDGELDITVTVDRARQLDAIRCHRSQATDNPVLWRRLELLGSAEHLRYLHIVA